MAAQSGWRHCQKCRGMFFTGYDAGVCPAGGGHLPEGFNFVLPYGVSDSSSQSGWRYCRRCRGMFWEGYGAGVCPAGGGHAAEGNNFALPCKNAPGAQSNWRHCERCRGLFFAGYGAGRCAGSGGHSAEGLVFSLPYAIAAPAVGKTGGMGTNFQLAISAVHHSKSVLTLGPENDWLAVAREEFGSDEQYKVARELRAMRATYARILPTRTLNRLAVRTIADTAKRFKTGRCGDFAAVAFTHLERSKAGVNFEMALCPHHWLVIVGRSFATVLNLPSSWNPETVVADAWNNTWYYGSAFFKNRSHAPTHSLRSDSTPSDGLILQTNWEGDW